METSISYFVSKPFILPFSSFTCFSNFKKKRNQTCNLHFDVHLYSSYRFNRAALINAGFIETASFDYFAIHDVDLLPANDNISYAYPQEGPRHLTPPELHPKYHYPTFLGGILLLTRSQFQLVSPTLHRLHETLALIFEIELYATKLYWVNAKVLAFFGNFIHVIFTAYTTVA